VTDTKPKTRKQLIIDARHAAMVGDWAAAIEVNLLLIERTPKDAEAYNRMGRALVETERYASAFEAYTGALKCDPANMIARRNLQRLDLLRRKHSGDAPESTEPNSAPVIPRTNVFIEEIGKTWVDEIVNPASLDDLAEVSPGEHLEIAIEADRIIVRRHDGTRLGEMEAKTAERLAELIAGGNRYEVYALGLSSSSLRVIVREVFRDPRQAMKVSFPRQISYRAAYLRDRDQLRQRDEADFLFNDEDDEDLDEEETSASPDDEVSGEAEHDTFEEDHVTVEEEESNI